MLSVHIFGHCIDTGIFRVITARAGGLNNISLVLLLFLCIFIY
jgi:hypothetical protein